MAQVRCKGCGRGHDELTFGYCDYCLDVLEDERRDQKEGLENVGEDPLDY